MSWQRRAMPDVGTIVDRRLLASTARTRLARAVLANVPSVALRVTSYHDGFAGRWGDVPGFSSRGIFVSYRREDTAPYARSLQLQLSQRFPDAPVFLDLDSI